MNDSNAITSACRKDFNQIHLLSVCPQNYTPDQCHIFHKMGPNHGLVLLLTANLYPY